MLVKKGRVGRLRRAAAAHRRLDRAARVTATKRTDPRRTAQNRTGMRSDAHEGSPVTIADAEPTTLDPPPHTSPEVPRDRIAARRLVSDAVASSAAAAGPAPHASHSPRETLSANAR